MVGTVDQTVWHCLVEVKYVILDVVCAYSHDVAHRSSNDCL
jgi:hypothetical protein